jgi:hypothetical protein
MRSRIRSTAALAAVLVAAGAGVAVSAGSAHAAQSKETVSCAGQTLEVRVVANKSSSGGWGAAHVVSGGTGHLNPTSFSGSFYDVTAGVSLGGFYQVKASGNANQNQPSITCTQHESGPIEKFLEPGETLPPGTSPGDIVTFDLTVTAVPHP